MLLEGGSGKSPGTSETRSARAGFLFGAWDAAEKELFDQPVDAIVGLVEYVSGLPKEVRTRATESARSAGRAWIKESVGDLEDHRSLDQLVSVTACHTLMKGLATVCIDSFVDPLRPTEGPDESVETQPEARAGPMGERYCSQRCYELGGQTVARHQIQGWIGDCSVCRGDLRIGPGQSGSMVCYKPGLFLYFHPQRSCQSAVRAELAEGTACVVCGTSVT